MVRRSPTIVPHGSPGRVVIPAPLTSDRLAIRAARELAWLFEPSKLQPGDTLGWLTLLSEPRPVMTCPVPCQCRWGMPPADVAPEDYFIEHPCWATADVMCNRDGWIIPKMLLSGNPMTQRISCGCHRDNPPDVARYLYQRGAYRLTPPPLKLAA